MDKRDIEKLRLKTQMNETLHLVETSPYQSIRQNAELKLKFLQEQYKGAFGEYSKEHEIAEKGMYEGKPFWEVTEARRKDGEVFRTGDKYMDGNNKTFTIKIMTISPNGKLMATAEEGGQIDLGNVKKA